MEQRIRLEKRTEYFDFLRIMATFAVVVIHVAAQNWYSADVMSMEWKAFNVYDSMVRWSVPIFVMISGALFLNGTQTLEKIYKKSIWRIVTAFAFWSVAYAALTYLQDRDLKASILQIGTGHYHMWFLFMIVGLYMIVPFLRKLVESEGLSKYFLVLALIFASILPQLLSCLALIIPTLAGTISQMLGHMQFHFAMGYAGYFVLGYQLHKMEISKKTERLIYGLGIFGIVMTAVMTDLVIVGTMQRIQIFYDYFTVNVLLQSIAVFVWMKKHAPNSLSDGAGKLLRKLSKYSFGAYLVHVMVIAVFKRLGLQTFSFNAWVSVPVISILVFAVSMGISAVINHIPILKKYIV